MHRLTGAAPAVAFHFQWDVGVDYGALRAHLAQAGLRIGAKFFELPEGARPDTGFERLEEIFHAPWRTDPPCSTPRDQCHTQRAR
ncbi:MAG: hypothetical protein ACLQA5_07750 [Solirubrobacteraceae bacterium]